MGRKILAVIVAMIVAIAIYMLVVMVNASVVTRPPDIVTNDPTALTTYMKNLPLRGYVVIIIGYILAAFAAGFIVTKMSRRESPGVSLPILVGILLTLLAASNIYQVPGQPIWFAVIIILISVPISLFGHRLAR